MRVLAWAADFSSDKGIFFLFQLFLIIFPLQRILKNIKSRKLNFIDTKS